MARRFIDQDEAAKMLGVTLEQLSVMRERQKVHGYRDGANWKFKPEEIERAIAERAEEAGDGEDEGEFAEIDEDPDSILLSEVELGGSDDSTSSTIIGGAASRNPAESDLQIATPKHDSDVDLDSALDLRPGKGSDVLGGSDVLLKTGSGVSPLFDDMDSLDLDLPSAADSGISSKIFGDAPPAAGSKGGSASDLLPLDSGVTAVGKPPRGEGSGLAFGSEDELSLGEADPEPVAAAGDDDELLVGGDDGGSAIELATDADDDLVLGGGGSVHGDLSRAGDSGISLLNPADSGLSLESEPLQLGGSAVESLDLGGDDDMILSEADGDADDDLGEAAADEQSDDDFLLTPLEEAGAEESDSGSQVIALDEDVEFEDAGALDDAGGGGGLLEDDLGEGLGGGGLGAAVALAPAPSYTAGPAAAGAAHAAAVDAPFSGWNIASLAMCSVLLLFIGMFMFDLLRNMWSWHGAYSVNSSLMEMVLGWFEG